jgi:D-xylose 1-dehydrogenase (NADP+, D-xylono-1,5-lactone-forming)
LSLRWGILSTANITKKLLGSGHDQQFVAVGSRDLGRAQAFASEHALARAYGSYEELLADPEVDAIYNPLPNSLHVEWSIKALEAGKHVLCEKPMSRYPEEVERAFDIAEREGRVLEEAFMWRHHPQVARTRELIAAGDVGELRVIRAAFAFNAADPNDIRLQADLDGGGLMDVGCYCVSGCRTLASAEPVRGYAEYIPGGNGGVDIVLAATLRFPGDVVAHFDCGVSYVGGDQLEAVGSEGSVFLDDPWHGREAVIELRRNGNIERIETGPANSYALELADFEAAVRGEHAPRSGPATHPQRRADAVAQARVIEALYTSAERNVPCPIG